MKDVMIDIESLGVGKNCCIVQIGACYFDRATGEIGDMFKVNIDARSAVASGAHLEADTVYWWLKQSPEAIASITAAPLLPIREAFEQLNLFLSFAKCIWSHATFDFVAITETYKRLNMKPSFAYKTARDIRTLIDIFNISTLATPREGLHHDGLADAIHQVKYCMEAFRRLDDLKQASSLISHIKSRK